MKTLKKQLLATLLVGVLLALAAPVAAPEVVALAALPPSPEAPPDTEASSSDDLDALPAPSLIVPINTQWHWFMSGDETPSFLPGDIEDLNTAAVEMINHAIKDEQQCALMLPSNIVFQLQKEHQLSEWYFQAAIPSKDGVFCLALQDPAVNCPEYDCYCPFRYSDEDFEDPNPNAAWVQTICRPMVRFGDSDRMPVLVIPKADDGGMNLFFIPTEDPDYPYVERKEGNPHDD